MTGQRSPGGQSGASDRTVKTPRQSARRPHWRMRFMAGVMTTLWVVVAARLIQIQGLQSEELSRVATRQHQIEVEVPARPADIVDRNGRLLATTVVTPSLFVNPSRLNVGPEFLEKLGAILELDADDLAEQIGRYKDKQFLWVKRRRLDSGVDAVGGKTR